jgi:hypothetical protein
MKRFFYFCLFLVFSFAFIINPQAFAAGKTLYDDFSSTYIDGSKWQQRTYVREIVDGQFVSKLGNRTPGMNAEISPGIFRNNLSFANPEPYNSIECDITIVETKLDSAPNSESFARIYGFFYNINETGGTIGDIFAQIMVGNRGNGGLEAFWEVQEMLIDDSITGRVIGNGTIIAPGTLKYNTPYKVKISYDGDRSFSFIANELNNSFIGPIKKRVAVSPWKGISSAINATNSSNNGFVFAKFDNVYKNDTVYEEFFSPPLDPDKWWNLESVREVSNGSLRASIQGIDSMSQVSTFLSESDTSYVEAKVRIESGSQLSPGASGIARIQGFYYNDSRGPGSGQNYNKNEDDVFVQVRLELDDNGNLKARAWVDKSEDANQTIWTTLFEQYFTTPIQFNTDYVLSIEYTDSQLIFKCNDETHSYAITTPEYSPFGEHRALRSRVYLDPGESGYLKAKFDDVYIEKKGKNIPSIPLLLLDD